MFPQFNTQVLIWMTSYFQYGKNNMKSVGHGGEKKCCWEVPIRISPRNC